MLIPIMSSADTHNEAKEAVLKFISALNSEDFDTARTLVTDDLTFIGVMGTRHGAEAYFKDMKQMKFKYDIKKVFADGTDVCLFYDINMSGTTIFASGWYQLQHGLIHTFNVLFDPRPLLEKK